MFLKGHLMLALLYPCGWPSLTGDMHTLVFFGETSKAEDTCVASFLHVRLPSCVSVSPFLVNT